MDISSKLNQKCVHWSRTGINKFNEPSYGSPEEVWCRWEDKTEIFVGLSGESEVSRAMVYIEIDTEPDDMLWLGIIEDLPDPTPDVRTFAHTIRRVDKIPDMQAEEYLRIAYL